MSIIIIFRLLSFLILCPRLLLAATRHDSSQQQEVTTKVIVTSTKNKEVGPVTCTVPQNLTDASSAACVDTYEKCTEWAEQGMCYDQDDFMLEYCMCSCKACPKFVQHKWDEEPQMAHGPLQAEILHLIQKTVSYMPPFFKAKECRNKHRSCSHWSLLGECENNPVYMLRHCAPSCQSCHTIGKHQRSMKR